MVILVNSYTFSSQNKKQNPAFGARKIPLRVANKYKNRMLAQDVKEINVISHASPDDDTRCANEVLSNWLTRNGKIVKTCINENKTKSLYISKSAYHTKEDFTPSDLAVAVDFSSESKIPKSFTELVKKYTKNNLIGFDHHKRLSDNLKGKIYRDNSAMSCCGVIYRFFQSLGETLSKKDYASLYCGVLSDYKKSGLVKIKDGKLIKLPTLDADKNSKEVLEDLEGKISTSSKNKIYKHLDVLANLKPTEKAFMKVLYDSIKVTQNGKFAYIAIAPEDKTWRALGMDNQRTSEILKSVRKDVLNLSDENKLLTPEQKEKFKSVSSVAVFYRSGSVYQMSMNSKPEEIDCTSLIKKAEKEWQKNNYNGVKMVGGGHEDRAGGRIFSLWERDAQGFVTAFVNAAEKYNAPKQNKVISALKNLFGNSQT